MYAWLRKLSIALVLAMSASACAPEADGAAQCLPELDRACTPLYEPTFDMIYENRIGATCGSAQTGGSCHGAAGKMGGLDMSSAELAYDHLLGIADDRARVKPGDPECSELMRRLESKDASYAMPPGAPLSAAERCSIMLWIDRGAER